MDQQVSIVLLHGLGSHPITMKPLEYYLYWKGFTNMINIGYPSTKLKI
jgi:triacylglycerol esterase/lipase EstA (alpha/beta hydrolase family)